MYKQQCEKRKSPAAMLLIMAFLLAFCLSIMLNSILAFAGIDSSKANKLFTGDNLTVNAPTANGTLVSGKDAAKESKINYNATLAMEYSRTLTDWTPEDPNDTDNKNGTVDFLTGVSGTSGHFNLRFSVDSLMSDTIVFEFTDYVDSKNALKITFDFSAFKAGENEGDTSTFDIEIIVEHTTDGWKNKTEEETSIPAAGNWDYTDSKGTHDYLDGKDYRHNMLESVIFELDLDYTREFSLKRFRMADLNPDDNDDTLVPVPFSKIALWTSSLGDLRFTNNTAKMSVSYEEPRTARNEEELNVATGLLFREINGQTLGNGNDERKDVLPVIMPDKKVTKPLFTDVFGADGSSYAGLKTTHKANVTFPIVMADAANFNIYGYYEVWELDPANSFELKGETPVETKDFSWNSSGISYYFEKEGFFEVRIFAGSLSSSDAVKDSVRQTSSAANDYRKVVVQRLTYRVVSDKTVGAPVLIDSSGQDLRDYVTAEFNNTQWQNLPAYQKDFTFPRPDGLFTNGIDEDYTYSFSIGYKFESDSSYQWTDSLSVRLTKTGYFTFKYVVKAPSGKKSTDSNEYFYDEDYPEFELIFSDNLMPEISLSTSQKTQTINKGNSFSAPTPTVTDNSTEGGYVIAAETRVWYAYADWKASNGLFDEGQIEKLTRVEFDENGKLKMNEVGIYYFVVFYQAEDTHNNRTAAFPEESEQGDVSDEKWSTSFWLLKVTVEDPDADNTNSTLLIILIVLGTLSFAGIIALLFVKPIDEVKWKARRERIKK